MLIKVRPDLFINSDALVSVFFDADKAVLQLHGGRRACISEAAAYGLLAALEVNESLTFDDTPTPESASLKSRLAVALRDTWKGASSAQLEAIFPDAGLENIIVALASLSADHVVVYIDGLWYHASSSEAQNYLRLLRNLTDLHLYHSPGSAYCGFIHPEIRLVFSNARYRVTCLNCLAMSSPDPSTAAAALPDAEYQAAADNVPTVAPKTEN